MDGGDGVYYNLVLSCPWMGGRVVKKGESAVEAYLDNSATTPVDERVRQVVFDSLAVYGNPSSLHGKGLEAELMVSRARAQVAAALGVKEDTVYFTSGGTEANNMAVFGAAMAKRRRGGRVVTTAIEHASVLESVRALAEQGFDCVFVPPESDGTVDAARVLEAVDENTVLLSVMHVNNETGSVLPVAQIAKEARRRAPELIVHCDAVQSFGKLPVSPKLLGADLITITAHKIHGPKGIGALYKSPKTRILPLLHGGEQQDRLRPGTENTAYIAAFGEACRLAEENREEGLRHAAELNAYLRELLAGLPTVTVNSPENALPYILNLSGNLARSEIMLHFLEGQGVYVSSGSACAKGGKSHVLEAMGLKGKRLDTALRISFGRQNGKEDCEAFAKAFAQGLKSLRH